MRYTATAATLAAITQSAIAAKSLWVSTTPQSPQPYALLKGNGIPLGYGDTWNVFPVTGNSSGGAFCLMITNGPGVGGTMTNAAGGFPHVHLKTYENFYASKGRVQLWGQNWDEFKNNKSAVQQTRVLAHGDFGAIPHNTIHTFLLLEPDTQLTGVLVPGGFEKLFFQMSSPGFNMGMMNSLDVYPESTFKPRTDTVNGIAGTGNWYNGPNTLPSNSTPPNFIAKNYGPKWLNNVHGYYQVVAPLVTGNQTDQEFSQGHITMSRKPDNVTAFKHTFTRPTAFLMEEGQLAVTVDGYDTVHLIDGDVVFVPGNTTFSYYAEAVFTKFMYVTGQGNGLDDHLIKTGSPTNSALYPNEHNVGGGAPISIPGLTGPTPSGMPGIGGTRMLRI